jgi:hypothetical protein
MSLKVIRDNGWETRVKEEPYTLYLMDNKEALSRQVKVKTLSFIIVKG